MRILLGLATAVTILAIALLLLMTPIWMHFALGATGSLAPGGDPNAMSDRTIGDLLAFGNFSFPAGDGSPMYTADEASHLRDARLVLYLFLGLALASVAFVAATLVRAPRDATRWRAISRGGLGLALGVVVVGMFAAFAFDTAFTLFHEIFFPGGNWAFAADSNMIRLYPEAFFELTGFTLGGLAAAGGVIVWLLARRRAAALATP